MNWAIIDNYKRNVRTEWLCGIMAAVSCLGFGNSATAEVLYNNQSDYYNAPPGTKGFDINNPPTQTIVARGETLFDIAERTRSPLEGLIAANHLEPPYYLNDGQIIYLPPIKVHIVKRGESFSQIADRYSVDLRSLAVYNKLPKPYKVYVGQRIILPAMVRDSLTGLEPQDLVDLLAGEISAGREISGSQKGTVRPQAKPQSQNHALKTADKTEIPQLPPMFGGAVATGAIPDKDIDDNDAAPVTGGKPKATKPVPKPPVKKTQKPLPQAHNNKAVHNDGAVSTQATQNDIAKNTDASGIKAQNIAKTAKAKEITPPSRRLAIPDNDDLQFSWPLKGRIIETFGNKPGFRRNDGIDISANENQAFRAAASGVVAYVGDQLSGYGWLILVKHNDKYITAYAYCSEPKVKEGQRVKKGEILGIVGKVGRANTPRLHFQIRENTKAENPINYLPKNG